MEGHNPGAVSATGERLDLSAVDALGLDIGGTKIAGARVSPDGEVLAHTSRPTTPDSPDGILDALSEIFQELGGQDALSAVGVAVAAFLNAERDSIFFSPNIAWRNFPLKSAVTERLGVPVVLENDANAAGWGEFRFGAARDVTSMLMLTIGTGVGELSSMTDGCWSAVLGWRQSLATSSSSQEAVSVGAEIMDASSNTHREQH